MICIYYDTAADEGRVFQAGFRVFSCSDLIEQFVYPAAGLCFDIVL